MHGSVDLKCFIAVGVSTWKDVFVAGLCVWGCFIQKVQGHGVAQLVALQAGRSRVRFPIFSLKFFVDIIFPAAIWPWGWLIL